jgi:saccharopine dehydrogenase-like NADP-dependent oxidoreductase
LTREVTVAVLGAGGTIAPALVRDLAESEEVSSLGLMDLNTGRAQAVADKHGLGKARTRAVDARAGFGDALEKYDVLVNAVSYRVNLEAMRACLWSGCHYIDLGGLYWQTDRARGTGASRYASVDRWELGGGVVSTGAPAAACVRLIARGKINATGVHPPESCVDPDDLFPELEAHGTTFDVEEVAAKPQ